MGTTITIPTELEQKIAKQAAASGLSLEDYGREVLERGAETPTLREIFAPVREQIKVSSTTDEELATEIEEAVSGVRNRRRE